MNATTKNIIKSTINAVLPNANILLFGSMVRGENNSSSDYDIMVITKVNYEEKEKASFKSKIRKSLIKALNAPIDILMNSEEEVNRKKNLPGHVVQWALKEGVSL